MAIGNFYPTNENIGTDIKDISNAPLDVSLGTGTWIGKQTIGLNSILIKQDNTGKSIGTSEADSVNINGAEDYIDTQWIRNITAWTIYISVEGTFEILNSDGTPTGSTSFRREDRRLTYNVSLNTKYYINEVLQNYNVDLPSLTESLKITRVAAIGYPDIVDTVYGPTKIYSN